MSAPGTQTRRLLLGLAASLASSLLVVAGYEGIENLLWRRWRERFDNDGWFGKLTVPSPNPALLWEYRPYGEKDGVATNRHGFRDRDSASREPARGVRRIAFAGDSVTLGIGIEEGDTFVRLFEAEANALHPPQPVEAMNFSIDGYDSLQVQELIRARVLGFSPAEVVYVMCLNDFDFEESAGQKHLYFRKPRSFLWMRLLRLTRRLFRVEYHRYHFARNRGVVLRGVAALNEELRQRDVGFRVALVPAFFREAPDFQSYPLADLHAGIGGFLAGHGVALLDLLPVFRGRAGAELYRDPWHLSPAGHRLVAGALARELEAAGGLPASAGPPSAPVGSSP